MLLNKRYTSFKINDILHCDDNKVEEENKLIHSPHQISLPQPSLLHSCLQLVAPNQLLNESYYNFLYQPTFPWVTTPFRPQQDNDNITNTNDNNQSIENNETRKLIIII